MRERGHGKRFAFEAGEGVGVMRKRDRKHLDRHFALQLHIARAIDLAHSANANGGEDLVRAEARAGRQGQRCHAGRW